MKLEREYEALLGGDDGLITKYPDRFPKEVSFSCWLMLSSTSPQRIRRLTFLQHFTYDNWVWAFTMLFSRAIRLRSLKEGETLAMVPYADLINHSAFSQAYIDAREGGDWLFSSGEEEVILYADRGYRKMEQVSDLVNKGGTYVQPYNRSKRW